MIAWYYLVIVSSLFISVAAIIEKYTLKMEHATAYSSAFALLAAVISLALIPLANFSMSMASVALIYAFSVVWTVTYLVNARVLKHGSISLSSPVSAALPTVFVVVMAFLFLSEKLTLLDYIGIAGIVISAYTIFFKLPQKDKPADPRIGKIYIYVLIANSLFGAVGSILGKYILFSVDPFAFLVLVGVFMAINFIAVITLRYNGIKEILGTAKRYRLPIAAIAVLTTVSRISYFYALKVAPVSIVQPLGNMVNVIVMVFIGGIIFNEGSIAKKLGITIIMMLFASLLFL